MEKEKQELIELILSISNPKLLHYINGLIREFIRIRK